MDTLVARSDMRIRLLVSLVMLLAGSSCYQLYDGLEDQWTIYYSLQPPSGGSGGCDPAYAGGQLELLRARNAGLRGAFDHDELVCTSSRGSITIPARRDTILSGQVFEAEQDSFNFVLNDPAWAWSGAQVERHVLRGIMTLTVNDSVVFTGWWQADRR